MIFNEGVFVPPTCPVEADGHIPDIRQVRFVLHVLDYPGMRERPDHTEIIGFFGYEENKPNVTTEPLEVPVHSALARQARYIANGNPEPIGDWEPFGSDTPAEQALGKVLCDRVARCQGVVDGECWALGRKGLAAALEAVQPDAGQSQADQADGK